MAHNISVFNNLHFFYSTAYNVRTRHELLESALGMVYPEEEYAYWLVTLLAWLLPTIVLVGALLDTSIVIVYMNFGHPWKGRVSNNLFMGSEHQNIW